MIFQKRVKTAVVTAEHFVNVAFADELGRGDYMRHLDAVFMEERRPGFRVSRRCEHDRHFFFDNDIGDCLQFRVHQRHIDPERLLGGFLAFADMLAQGLRMHGSGPDEAQSSVFADGRCQSPAAAPYHAARNDRVADAEELADAVLCAGIILLGMGIDGLGAVSFVSAWSLRGHSF